MIRTFVLVFLMAVVFTLGAASSTSAEEPCIQLWDPVCGVDGETYSNSCTAEQARVSIAYTGECLACGGIGGLKCPKSFLCDPVPGLCGVDVPGTCMPRPKLDEFCPEVYRPVCGCDGKTYSNRCERLKAGQPKDHNGACMKKEQLPKARPAG